ncbi:MAG: potassium channel family protein [Phycisphaerales bacterium JB039]
MAVQPATRHHLDRRITRPILAVVFVLAVGTLGYEHIEGWSIQRSFFFTIISLSTVGYGDYGLSRDGQIFTTFLLLGGIGIMTYSVGQIVQIAVERQMDKERKMRRTIEHMSEHYIICGLGRLGRAVCQRLAGEDIPFVGVDVDDDVVTEMIEQGLPALAGDATSDDFLRQAGIERARGLVCVSGSDTDNIVMTLSARAMRPDLEIISRAEHEDSVRKLERAGATRVISPVRSSGARIVDTILRPHLTDFLERACLGEQDLELAEITIQPGSTLDGSTTGQYGSAHPELVFVAMRTGGQTCVRPASDRPLAPGDVLLVAGRSNRRQRPLC